MGRINNGCQASPAILMLKKSHSARMALCWLPVLFFAFLMPALKVFGAESDSKAYDQAQPEFDSLDEVAGKKIGMITGFDTVLKGALEHENKFVYYPSATDSVTALQTGRVDAVCLDLVLMAAKELDLKVEMTICDFGALVPAIQSGKADIASGCMDITEEKKRYIDFSEPYCKSAVVLPVRDQNAKGSAESFRDRSGSYRFLD